MQNQIRTPIPVTPLVIPTYARGNIAAIKVAAEANIMKNALLILNLSAVAVLLVAIPLFNTSSVIIIWSSTPVPMAARIPAIAGKINCPMYHRSNTKNEYKLG